MNWALMIGTTVFASLSMITKGLIFICKCVWQLTLGSAVSAGNLSYEKFENFSDTVAAEMSVALPRWSWCSKPD